MAFAALIPLSGQTHTPDKFLRKKGVLGRCPHGGEVGCGVHPPPAPLVNPAELVNFGIWLLGKGK